MRRRGTWLATGGAICTCLMLLGFVLFANSATRSRDAGSITADGIVVLTGAKLRIQEGMRLLNAGHGRRLLITGVNQVTKRGDIKRLLRGKSDRFDCCVDLGYEARNTRGNAHEIAEWAERHQFSKIIVVTSNYHMPRAMAEVGRACPRTVLIPHVVVPDALRDGPWWLNGQATKLLAYEYVKFLPAVIKLGAARALQPWTKPTLAGNRVEGEHDSTRSNNARM